ncbi:DUF742 domain-containing protein (plasmid) [Streptomyces viridifaciens]|nr:DUF742 domain-containing protein [Streptomyces viridifaciens]
MNKRSDPGLVRPYVKAGGRLRASQRLALIALVVPGGGTMPDPGPEHGQIMALFGTQGTMSVAEIAAYIGVPPSVTRILVSDLIDHGCLAVHTADRPDTSVLEEVLRGLHKLVA